MGGFKHLSFFHIHTIHKEGKLTNCWYNYINLINPRASTCLNPVLDPLDEWLLARGLRAPTSIADGSVIKCVYLSTGD